ncbi:MAG: (2Fe-2S) ferredoxin domain-containing protein [Spirochaetia bacterium]|jgi:NADH:ubiquinone oxidoreductase subunit E|nr:(2Fe-2S) ferredoxin domain-containing protein [Spirochaetia bacterium]MCF7941230.1 (2Fe-2S) ferredoxin domain-containing protein [Spirochaetia bacterium]
MKIELCMGSSCFARGNAAVLEALELYASQHEDCEIVLAGHLCLRECSKGPNIRIDGELCQGLGPREVISRLKQLQESKP